MDFLIKYLPIVFLLACIFRVTENTTKLYMIIFPYENINTPMGIPIKRIKMDLKNGNIPVKYQKRMKINLYLRYLTYICIAFPFLFILLKNILS
jgi:hypothetical protein